MRRTAIMAGVVALLAPASAAAVHDNHYQQVRAEHHRPPPLSHYPHFSRRATIYGTSECDANSPGHTTADGSNLYRAGPTIASNAFPLGTIIRFDHRLFGYLHYRVRDTGGGGSSLFDVFHKCPLPPWDNPTLGFRVIRWG